MHNDKKEENLTSGQPHNPPLANPAVEPNPTTSQQPQADPNRPIVPELGTGEIAAAMIRQGIFAAIKAEKAAQGASFKCTLTIYLWLAIDRVETKRGNTKVLESDLESNGYGKVGIQNLRIRMLLLALVEAQIITTSKRAHFRKDSSELHKITEAHLETIAKLYPSLRALLARFCRRKPKVLAGDLDATQEPDQTTRTEQPHQAGSAGDPPPTIAATFETSLKDTKSLFESLSTSERTKQLRKLAPLFSKMEPHDRLDFFMQETQNALQDLSANDRRAAIAKYQEMLNISSEDKQKNAEENRTAEVDNDIETDKQTKGRMALAAMEQMELEDSQKF